MKTGKVKSLAVSGKGNKIHRTGDAVKESNFPEGNWKELVTGGHITEDEVVPAPEALPEWVEPEKSKAEVTPEPEPVKADAKDEVAPEPDAKALPAYDDITAGQIKALLTEKGIEFDKNAGKKVLYDLLKG